MKIGEIYYNKTTERMFLVSKIYKDGGVLFQNLDQDNHFFKLMPQQFKSLVKVDESDLRDCKWVY